MAAITKVLQVHTRIIKLRRIPASIALKRDPPNLKLHSREIRLKESTEARYLSESKNIYIIRLRTYLFER